MASSAPGNEPTYRDAAELGPERFDAAAHEIALWLGRVRAAVMGLAVGLGLLGGAALAALRVLHATNALGAALEAFPVLILYGGLGMGFGVVLVHWVGPPILSAALRWKARAVAEGLGVDPAAFIEALGPLVQ